MVTVRGNEPFTAVVLETPGGNWYVLDLTAEPEKVPIFFDQFVPLPARIRVYADLDDTTLIDANVTLGKPAASLLLGRDIAITRVRGTWQDYQGIPLMPTLHPAYVLRQYTQENRRAVWEDLRAAHERSRG